MEKSSKRGKIPQQDWPSIIVRYEAGETLASIARTYDCSPPAISYIVSRTRARSAAADATAHDAPPSAEPQLIKGPSTEIAAPDMAADEMPHDGAAAREATRIDLTPPGEPRLIERPSGAPPSGESRLFGDEAAGPGSMRRDLPRDGYRPAPRDGHDAGHSGNSSPVRAFVPAGGSPGGPAGGAAPNGEARRTLHLSLQGNGGPEPSPNGGHGAAAGFGGERDRSAPRPPAVQSSFSQAPRLGQGPIPPSVAPSVPSPGPGSAAPARGFNEPQRTKEAPVFIDQALRERVDGDIVAFLAAFDAALEHDTPESRTGLREATDRLLRAGARTRIELERLEARAPLPPRDKSGQSAPVYRQR